MSSAAAAKRIYPHHLFAAFKYLIYGLLALNVILFFREEWLATDITFAGGISLDNVVSGFAATIDTAAWVVLLLLFELETSLLSDDTLRHHRVKWMLHGVRAVAYLFILYAFYGYCSKVWMLYGVSPLQASDPCTLADAGYFLVMGLDEYQPLNSENCVALTGQPLFWMEAGRIVGTAEAWQAIQRLAWVDVINAADWLIIVMVLEIDVRLQLAGHLTGRKLLISKWLKGLLYSVLFLAAAYWGILGDFLDFWDAFLWLVAFIFIEMNLFQWQSETQESVPETAGASPGSL